MPKPKTDLEVLRDYVEEKFVEINDRLDKLEIKLGRWPNRKDVDAIDVIRQGTINKRAIEELTERIERLEKLSL